MKKNIIVFLICLCSFLDGLYAQSIVSELPKVIPSSPQAAQFARYGEIPVGHTSGVPQIEIPLFALNTGVLDIPISISYHASGFRPADISSPVGLGWVLNAGGLISRSIDGNADYSSGNLKGLYDSPIKTREALDSVKWGYNTIWNPPINMNQYTNVTSWETFFMGSSPMFDIRSDRYSYNFLGHGGNGRLDIKDRTRELKTMPYEPLKFQYYENEEMYRVIDTKGILYEFGEQDHVTASGVSNATVSGWYLTRIIFPGLENDPVIFTYRRGELYSTHSSTQISCYVNHVPTIGRSNSMGIKENDLYENLVFSAQNYDSPLIESISWRDITVTFNYTSDRPDRMKERLTDMQVKQGNSLIRKVVFNNNSYFGTISKNKRLRLDSVSFVESGETYSFSYDNTKNSSLPIRYGEQGEAYCAEDYWGYWNGTASNWWFPSAVASFWNPSISPKTISSSNRTPSLSYTKACVLEEIVWPGKGKTRFEYEQNKAIGAYYSSGWSEDREIMGGLRLKRRINYSDAGAVIDVKEYEYQGRCLLPSTFQYELYFSYSTRFVDNYVYNIGYTPNSANVAYQISYFVSNPLISVYGMGQNSVFYYEVKEYDGTSSNNNGWTIYQYRQSHGETSDLDVDGPGIPRALIETSDYDRGPVRGDLSTRSIYDANGLLVFRSANTYTRKSTRFHTGIRITPGFETDGSWTQIVDYGYSIENNNLVGHQSAYNEMMDNLYGYNTYAFQDCTLPAEKTDIYYKNGQLSYQETTAYIYDYDGNGYPVLLIPRSVSRTNSTGSTQTQTTVFPYHTAYKNSYPYFLMNSNHMLEYPVEEKIYMGNDTLTNVYTKYRQLSGNLIRPQKVSVGHRNGVIPENRIIYENYNSRGNPVYMIRDNMEKVVYLWSYNYKYPIIQIRNATYAEVKAAMGYTDEHVESLAIQPFPSASSISQLAAIIKNSLPTAQVTSYTYKPLVGIEIITAPNGTSTTYKYDNAGRLSGIEGPDGRINELYEYHYKP